MTNDVPLFTNHTLVSYYVYETHYLCLHCQKVASKVCGQKIMVEYELNQGGFGSIPLTTYMERLGKIYDLPAEEVLNRLPKLPFTRKTHNVEHNFCAECMGESFGDEKPTSFPAILPAPQPIKAGPRQSPNWPMDEKPKKKKKKRKSRSIHADSPKAQEKREQLNRIRSGDLDALF